jgi:AcrR family transcriptional regulator
MASRKAPRGRAAPRPPRRRGSAPEEPARERILAAALEVFAEHGFEGARTREIAVRAGANLGLLAYYFDGKEPLWREAVSRAFGELQRELGGLAAEPANAEPASERERLESLLRGFVRFVARRPAFMRLMNDEGKRDGPRMRWLADRYVKPMATAFRQAIERAQAQGALPALPPASLHYIALGAAGLLFSQAPECAYVMGIDPTSEGFAKAHADAVVQMLLGPRS